MSSATRCHVCGAILSLLLIVATGWIWSNADRFAEDEQYTSQQIAAANQLIADADDLRSKYAHTLVAAKQIDKRIAAIRAWLPPETHWEQTLQRIRKIAQSANVQLTSIDKGKQHLGDRIGVLSCDCDLQGSYADICQCLSDLSRGETPIWCDSIRIHRSPPALQDPQECSASLSLRAPFAASGTIAGKLLGSEVRDAD
jgi:Tfp pilus assembly protein PilO